MSKEQKADTDFDKVVKIGGGAFAGGIALGSAGFMFGGPQEEH